MVFHMQRLGARFVQRRWTARAVQADVVLASKTMLKPTFPQAVELMQKLVDAHGPWDAKSCRALAWITDILGENDWRELGTYTFVEFQALLRALSHGRGALPWAFVAKAIKGMRAHLPRYDKEISAMTSLEACSMLYGMTRVSWKCQQLTATLFPRIRLPSLNMYWFSRVVFALSKQRLQGEGLLDPVFAHATSKAVVASPKADEVAHVLVGLKTLRAPNLPELCEVYARVCRTTSVMRTMKAWEARQIASVLAPTGAIDRDPFLSHTLLTALRTEQVDKKEVREDAYGLSQTSVEPPSLHKRVAVEDKHQKELRRRCRMLQYLADSYRRGSTSLDEVANAVGHVINYPGFPSIGGVALFSLSYAMAQARVHDTPFLQALFDRLYDRSVLDTFVVGSHVTGTMASVAMLMKSLPRSSSLSETGAEILVRLASRVPEVRHTDPVFHTVGAMWAIATLRLPEEDLMVQLADFALQQRVDDVPLRSAVCILWSIARVTKQRPSSPCEPVVQLSAMMTNESFLKDIDHHQLVLLIWALAATRAPPATCQYLLDYAATTSFPAECTAVQMSILLRAVCILRGEAFSKPLLDLLYDRLCNDEEMALKVKTVRTKAKELLRAFLAARYHNPLFLRWLRGIVLQANG